jgi:hypothetical protein
VYAICFNKFSAQFSKKKRKSKGFCGFFAFPALPFSPSQILVIFVPEDLRTGPGTIQTIVI